MSWPSADVATSSAAASTAGATTGSMVQFRLNNFQLRMQFRELPTSLEGFTDIANHIPGGPAVKGRVSVVAFIEKPGTSPQMLMLKDRTAICEFWTRVAAEAEEALVSVSVVGETTHEAPRALPAAASGASGWWLWPSRQTIVVFSCCLLAVVFPCVTRLLPADVAPLAIAGQRAINSVWGAERMVDDPREAMTNFALANVRLTEKYGDKFLESMLMTDAQAYSKAVLFEAQVSNKRTAVINALSNTKLPKEVIERISSEVGNTTDGKPVVRPVKRPVFDGIKAPEMDALRRYLLTMASHDALRNYAPHMIPGSLLPPIRLLPVHGGGAEAGAAGGATSFQEDRIEDDNAGGHEQPGGSDGGTKGGTVVRPPAHGHGTQTLPRETQGGQKVKGAQRGQEGGQGIAIRTASAAEDEDGGEAMDAALD